MKKFLSILLATMFCLSIFGCKDNLCVCENKETEEVNDNTDGDQEVYNSKEEKIYRNRGVYGSGVWVLEVDVKKDKLMSILSYIDWYFTELNYSKEGNIYGKKLSLITNLIRFMALEVRSSSYDENSNTILFYTWLKDSNNRLLSPYDKTSMDYMESLSSFIDKIEKGEIQ